MGKVLETVFDLEKKPLASRASFGQALVDLGKNNEDIVVLDADLSKSTQTQHFAKEFPKRFFNMGIAEANMIGVAAGLARSGKVPFAASFGAFLTGRFDQIRMSVAFSNTPVKLVGTHAGVGIGEDGHSQMALEDVTLMRSLPNMIVLQPADDTEAKAMIEWSVKTESPCYFRLTRQGLKHLKRDSYKIEPNSWKCVYGDELLEVDDIFVATGPMLYETVAAVDKLLENNPERKVAVFNASWLNKISEQTLNALFSKKAKRIWTVEDHYTVGGLGGLLAEAMAENAVSAKLIRVGVEDFGQSGSPADNLKAYKLDADSLLATFSDL